MPGLPFVKIHPEAPDLFFFAVVTGIHQTKKLAP